MGVEGRSPHPRRAHNYEKCSFVVIVCYNKHALFTGQSYANSGKVPNYLGIFLKILI
jgi:hypothetical protein